MIITRVGAELLRVPLPRPRSLPRADEPVAEDPCVGFLHLLLPELHRALFSPRDVRSAASGQVAASPPTA